MIPEKISDEPVRVRLGGAEMGGVLSIPSSAAGVILFANPRGSRKSFQDRLLARRLHEAGLGTLLADLLTPLEALEHHRRLNIPFLAERLSGLTQWLGRRLGGTGMRIGYLGTSLGAAAAMAASVSLGDAVAAIVSRGGRLDLVPEVLPQVQAPTLLIAGASEDPASFLTLRAYNRLRGAKEIALIRGATHLLEEPRAFEKVSLLSAAWFRRFLPPELAVPSKLL